MQFPACNLGVQLSQKLNSADNFNLDYSVPIFSTNIHRSRLSGFVYLVYCHGRGNGGMEETA